MSIGSAMTIAYTYTSITFNINIFLSIYHNEDTTICITTLILLYIKYFKNCALFTLWNDKL